MTEQPADDATAEVIDDTVYDDGQRPDGSSGPAHPDDGQNPGNRDFEEAQ